jgi:hypothetical protein
MKEETFSIICSQSSCEDQNFNKFQKELQDYIKSTWPNAKIIDDEKKLDRFVVQLQLKKL